ncbi:hypothetical protein [Gordonia sp. (in: high G+C Gram-positive bacteria)]|uniref:hypothetical protein n=1 Tax=Gordonia sp. (in: high G+C Gram-positive bacteria) TaxID=84139 RepID=UPI003527A255
MDRSPSSVRATVLDRMHAGTRVAAVAGPLELPGEETARERLLAFAALGPATRIGLRPAAGRWRWRHDPQRLAAAVSTAAAPADPLRLLRGARSARPLSVTLAGDYLLTEHDHGIGEIQLALYVKMAVTGLLTPSPELYRGVGGRRAGLATATARVFGSDPRRIRRVLTILEGLPDPIEPPAAAPASVGPVLPVSVETASLDATAVAEIRRWRDLRGVRASLKTLLLCGMVRAFDDAGLTLHDDIAIPVDLRRYLKSGANPLGNFVAGLEFRHRPGDDPAALQHAITETIASGRPVASAVRSSVTAGSMLLSGRTPAGESWPGRPRLLFSGINEMAEFRRFGWLDTQRAAFYGRVDPMGPGDLTLATVGVHGAVTLSVSFHPDRLNTDVISTALRRFADDPGSHFG